MGPETEWHVDQPYALYGDFNSLATTFPTFFQLPVHRDSGLELLTHYKQTPSTHISDHIHEWKKPHSLCKTQFEDKVLLDLFLRSLTSEISKGMENSSPKTKEEAISKSQQLELIYT